MKRFCLAVILSVFAFCCSEAQWTLHLAMSNSMSFQTTEGQVMACSSGFFLNNKNDGSLLVFNKANHLSDVNITAISSHGSIVYVGYANGNIDVVDVADFTTINIPELKNYSNLENKTINNIYRYNSNLLCSTNSGVIVVDLNKYEIKARYTVDKSLPSVNCIAIRNDSIYASTSIGFFRAYMKSKVLEDNDEWERYRANDVPWPGWLLDYEGDFPNAPANNNSYDIVATPKGIFCTAGGFTDDYNNQNRPIQIHSYINNSWHTASAGSRDALKLAVNPNARDSVYFSTWGSGVFKVNTEDGSVTQHYTAENSTLMDILGGSAYTRNAAIAYDMDGNLHVCQAEVDAAIAIKGADGQWYSCSYPGLTKFHSTRMMLISSNNNAYVCKTDMTLNPGIFVYNTNGTIEDDSDDMYRGKNVYDDDRDMGEIHLWDEDGEIISDYINDIIEDKNNVLWFATNHGIATFTGDKDVFTTERPLFRRIKVPRNDGTNNADYLLDGVRINALAVDGANRKWIGTDMEGVYLVSADGTETIHAFNTSNSPLISNTIYSIAVHPTTGEVFFATPLGIVSYQGDAIEPVEKMTKSGIKVFPNPVGPDYNGEIRMTGFSDMAQVKVTDTNGRLVFATETLGGMTTWNGRGLDGRRVASGVYIVWATDSEGTEKAVAKILFVK